MNISFYGAAGEVTGSCSLLQSDDRRILVDCGLFQGRDFSENRNSEDFGFDPTSLSAVIITHSHLDHIGRLPILSKQGYNGPVFATPPTVDLVRLVLDDAFSVMTYNAKKMGTEVPYSMDDVDKIMSQFVPVEYGEEYELPGGNSKASFKFHDAGHIFGSAFVEVKIDKKILVFSGDIGNVNVPILRDTEDMPKKVDFLLCESLYGDRLHDTRKDRRQGIKDIIVRAMKRGGVLMVPAFSVERTQELLYDLNDLIDHKDSLPKNLSIFLDSPLAIRATKVFDRYPKYFDKEAKKVLFSGDDLFKFRGLTICLTRDESMLINKTSGQKLIMAGAGMMNGGRIQHHAKRYLSDPKNTLFFTGFQAPRTLGRQILDGAETVHILGEYIRVRCHIEYLNVLSAHADSAKLVSWISSGSELPTKICLNHGEPNSSQALKKLLEKKLGVDVVIADVENVVKV